MTMSTCQRPGGGCQMSRPSLDLCGQLDLFRRVDPSVAGRKSRRQQEPAGWCGERDRGSVACGIGDEKSAGLPFRVVAEHDSARVARGIPALVVEPEHPAGLFRLCHGALERPPFRLADEIIVERYVTDHAAEPCFRELLDELILRRVAIGPRVNDLENPRLGRRIGEPLGERAVVGDSRPVEAGGEAIGLQARGGTSLRSWRGSGRKNQGVQAGSASGESAGWQGNSGLPLGCCQARIPA